MVGYGASEGGLVGYCRFLGLVVPVAMWLSGLRLVDTVAFYGSGEVLLLTAAKFQLGFLLIGHRDAKAFVLRL